jgi:hypothetical protein
VAASTNFVVKFEWFVKFCAHWFVCNFWLGRHWRNSRYFWTTLNFWNWCLL